MQKLVSLQVILLFICSLFLFACTKTNDQAILLVGETMGTSYSIKIIDRENKVNPTSLQKKIDQSLSDINSMMSTYETDSELSRLNRNHTSECILISEQLGHVIQQANKISQLTEGYFDITVGPLVNLWGFGPDSVPTNIPSEEAINDIKNSVGYSKLLFSDNETCLIKQHSDIYIDLSAIAKGYAVDKIAELLESSNFTHYMIEIGGEIKARGHNINNIAWQIGIEKPISSQRSVQKIIPLQDLGLATSGDYRNYFEHNGKRYSHLIDANTGKPITNNLVSVTVLHKSTMMADALATAFMIMGHEKAFSIAGTEKLAVLFILKQENEFREISTPGFSNITKH